MKKRFGGLMGIGGHRAPEAHRCNDLMDRYESAAIEAFREPFAARGPGILPGCLWREYGRCLAQAHALRRGFGRMPNSVGRASCPVAYGASMGGAWRRLMLFAEGSAGCQTQPAGCRRSPPPGARFASVTVSLHLLSPQKQYDSETRRLSE